MDFLILIFLVMLGDKFLEKPEMWPWAALITTVVVSGGVVKRVLDHKHAKEMKALELGHKRAILDNEVVAAELKRPKVLKSAAKSETPAPQAAETGTNRDL